MAARPRFAVVFLMVLTMGVSLRLPAEDVLDAVYDESEALPYEVIPLFSVALRPMAARTTRAVPSSVDARLVAPSRSRRARARDTDADRSAAARVSLALLCILLC